MPGDVPFYPGDALDRERKRLENRLLPALERALPGYRFEKLAAGTASDPQPRPWYGRDPPTVPLDADGAVHRLYDRDLDRYFFRDRVTPQYAVVPHDATAADIAAGDYAAAVETRGVRTVHVQDDRVAGEVAAFVDDWADAVRDIWPDDRTYVRESL